MQEHIINLSQDTTYPQQQQCLPDVSAHLLIPKPAQSSKQQRLAAALRDNLKRRKASSLQNHE